MRCGVCGSERLSPVGELVTGDRWRERLRFRFPSPGLFKVRPVYEALFARACRDCGTLIPFLSETDRRQLDADADSLESVEPY